MKRWGLFWAGIALSLAITLGLWSLGIGGVGLFLFLPFLFFPWARRPTDDPATGKCALCGRIRMPGDQFCPRDGTPYHST